MTKEEKQELAEIWEHIKIGRAKDKSIKINMVEFYNKQTKSRYRPTTRCASCLNTIYEWFKSQISKI